LGVRVSGYVLWRVEQNAELGEEVGGELITVDEVELA